MESALGEPLNASNDMMGPFKVIGKGNRAPST